MLNRAMIVVDITLRRHPRVHIETPKGNVRWGEWLEQEAERLRNGRFWKECFVFDEDGRSIGLIGVPRRGDPERLCREDGSAYEMKEPRAA